MDGTALAQSVFHLVCGISLHTGIHILVIITIVSIIIPTTNIMSVVVFAILTVIKNTYIYHYFYFITIDGASSPCCLGAWLQIPQESPFGPTRSCC